VVPVSLTAPRSLPPATTVELSKVLVERWLEQSSVPIHWRWRPPGVGTPLSHGRADLLVIRDD
jgi:hypothetical protein